MQQARENPEPVFDVSECALKNVPSGIYSLCKVFRKKILLMYDNKLSSLSGGGALCDLSLLTVLDIHENEFTILPSDIMCLSSLKVSLSENLFIYFSPTVIAKDKTHKKEDRKPWNFSGNAKILIYH